MRLDEIVIPFNVEEPAGPVAEGWMFSDIVYSYGSASGGCVPVSLRFVVKNMNQVKQTKHIYWRVTLTNGQGIMMSDFGPTTLAPGASKLVDSTSLQYVRNELETGFTYVCTIEVGTNHVVAYQWTWTIR